MLSHVLFVAQGATAEAMARRHLRQQGYAVQEVEPERAVTWTRQRLPDLIVWSGPDAALGEGFRDLRLHPATWNVPVVHLVDEASAPTDLLVEPDRKLVGPCERRFAQAIDEAVSARDRRLREGIRAELRLQLPSGLDQLERLCLLMTEWSTLCGLKRHQNQQMNMAVRELAANAIEWGHRYDRSRLVHVCAWLEDDRVCVLVRDSGQGFDRRNLPHAARHGDCLSHLDVRATQHLREGGFGILMASGLVDYLCYNDTGNEGLVVKFLPRSAVPSQGERVEPRPAGLAS